MTDGAAGGDEQGCLGPEGSVGPRAQRTPKMEGAKKLRLRQYSILYCEKISDCLHSAAVMLALSLLTTSFQLQRAPLAHTITAARSSAVRMGEPGTPANIDDYKEYEFSKRKTTDDGSCFIVDDKEAPDPARSWFYCDEYASTAFPRFKIVCPRHVR